MLQSQKMSRIGMENISPTWKQSLINELGLQDSKLRKKRWLDGISERLDEHEFEEAPGVGDGQ